MTHTHSQSGNALWFILLAVALLGALTFVLSRSSSSVDQSGDVEQRRVQSSQIMRYAKSIEAAIQQLQLNGCSENEISFQNTTDLNYTNPRSPADNSCHIFDAAGAGLTWRELTDQSFTGGENLAFSGALTVYGLEDDTRAELIIRIPVSQSLCTQINDEYNISNVAADITSDLDTDVPFIGAFPPTFDLGNGADKAPVLSGQNTGCFIDDNGDRNFYHVLLAR